MKNVFINSVLVVFALLVASCGRQPEAKVEVMSFNIRLDHVADSMNNWKYRKDHAAQMIAYYAPDIIGMQEVVKNQLDDLKERLPQYTALGVGRADGEEKGEYCSLFYKTDRFELLKSGNFGLSETPDSIGKKGWDAACERIVTWAVLKDKVSGREIAAFNTHFDHVGKVARRESAVLILEKIKQIVGDLPVIVTGDFNGTVDSEPVTVLTEGGMKNACVTAKVAYGPTWSFHDFGRIPVEKRRLIDFKIKSKSLQYLINGKRSSTNHLIASTIIHINSISFHIMSNSENYISEKTSLFIRHDRFHYRFFTACQNH